MVSVGSCVGETCLGLEWRGTFSWANRHGPRVTEEGSVEGRGRLEKGGLAPAPLMKAWKACPRLGFRVGNNWGW